MSDLSWHPLQEALGSEQPFEHISDGTIDALVEELQDVIRPAGAEDRQALADLLVNVSRHLATQTEVGRTATGRKGTAGRKQQAQAAYRFGQIAFAQVMASRILERQASAVFLAALKNDLYLPYLRALLEGERSGVELASRVGVKDETVSRKLRVLRELGLTDFRRVGTTVLNFLTPAAKAAMGEADRIDNAPRVDEAVSRAQEEGPERFKKLRILAPDPKMAA